MRHTPFRCSPSHIRARAQTELHELLDWKDVTARFTTDTIVRVLGLMATLKASLHHVAQRFVWPVGETTLRAGIAGQLPDPVALAAAFHRRFLALVPRVPKNGFVVAIDTHWSCFYGRRGTRGTVHGQRKNGTRRYFVYATAVIVQKGTRYTLAVSAPESGRPMDALVPLLDQMAGAGIVVRKLLLDKGFFAAEVFHALEHRRLNYIVAVPHRRRFKTTWDRTATRATVTITSRATAANRVTATVRLVGHRRRNRDGSVTELVYAYRGVRSPGDLGVAVRRAYRARFGIESSYRQLRQAKAPTTSRDRSWRLLVIGIALLLRQLWVLLGQAVSGPVRTGHAAGTGLERLRQQLAAALIEGLEEHHVLRLKPKHAAYFRL